MGCDYNRDVTGMVIVSFFRVFSLFNRVWAAPFLAGMHNFGRRGEKRGRGEVLQTVEDHSRTARTVW